MVSPASSTGLLTKILVFAAEGAADAALALPAFIEEDVDQAAAAPNAVSSALFGGGGGGGGGGRAGALASETEWASRRHGAGAGAAAGAGVLAGTGAGNMSDFRRRATGALRAARSMADQMGIDPHSVQTIIFRLAKGWICQQRLRGGGGGVGADAGMFVGAGLMRGDGGGGGDSVFVRDAREVGWVGFCGWVWPNPC